MAQASILTGLSPSKLGFSWGFQAELSWHNTLDILHNNVFFKVFHPTKKIPKGPNHLK